jgi:DNA adenine methylase
MERPVLIYFGGKFRLSSWVSSFFPSHKTYVEAFAGAASVLMSKPRSKYEIYNDLNDQIVTVFRVLRNQKSAKELERQLRLTPFSRTEFLGACEIEKNDEIEIARKAIIRSFMGFSSDALFNPNSKGFKGACITSFTPPQADWVNYWDCIKAFTKRLEGGSIENKDALELIARLDAEDTLFYLDPPYVQETRRAGTYMAHEMVDADHIRLIDLVKNLKGFVVLSGYDHAIYNSLDWEKRTIESKTNNNQTRVETIWLNPKTSNSQVQMELV